MRLVLLALLAFGCKKDKETAEEPATAGSVVGKSKAPPPPKDPPPCPGIDGALADAIRGDLRRVQVGPDGRLAVVVEPKPEGATLPAEFTETARAEGLIQGWIAADQVCALAAAPGVSALRAPILAKPKEGQP